MPIVTSLSYNNPANAPANVTPRNTYPVAPPIVAAPPVAEGERVGDPVGLGTLVVGVTLTDPLELNIM